MKWGIGLLSAALLLMKPEAAVNGAREAMGQWYRIVAPSLFPFMALMPLLTCDEALHLYDALLGGLTRRVYRLPGAAASALAIGVLGGSPAGCAAASRVKGLTRGQYERLALSACGLSPAFLISGVGAAMLGNPALGRRLFVAQVIVQLTMPALLMPICRNKTPVETAEVGASGQPVMAVLNVCGYMALFGAIGAAVGELIGAAPGRVFLCAMDITAGMKTLTVMRAPLPALSALAGFGGLCVCAQNLSVLKGIHPAKFVLARLLAAALEAGLTFLMNIKFSLNNVPDVLPLSCFFACVLAMPVIVRLKRTVS